LSTLRKYWERVFSRLKTPSEPDGPHTSRTEDLERKISTVSGENKALAEEVQRVRLEFENTRDEENRKIDDLEQVRQAMELARNEDLRKLAELESLNNTIATARDADSKKILDLERWLAEIESGRNQARDKVKALEHSLAKTSTRLEKTDAQLEDLQELSVEQARQFSASLSDASDRLASTDNHVRELGNRLENDRQDYLKTWQDMQGRLRKQDVRMNWTITAAGFALLLATVAGAVLIWGVQKNATMLSSMSQDIKALMTSGNGHSSKQHTLQEEQRQPALPATAPEPGTTVTAKPASSAAAKPQPEVPANATISKADSEPYSSVVDPARARPGAGERKPTREDVKTFFEENANVAGMISLPSGAQYRVVTPGSGETPSLSDKVVVAYVATKLDGTIADETYSDGEPSTVSMKEVLPVWREVLLTMEEGAEFELYVPPHLATRGGVRKRSLRGLEPIVYLIELLEVVKEGELDQATPVN
jgi:FKBP-type peptidyl-prolyl cis-trans isomerase/predicted  nucleic acid-binding Zn-ribbon protein